MLVVQDGQLTMPACAFNITVASKAVWYEVAQNVNCWGFQCCTRYIVLHSTVIVRFCSSRLMQCRHCTLQCRMLLSRQFHPRIGALAAVNMSKRQQDAHGSLQEPLLHPEAVTLNVQANAATRPVTRPVSRQVSDVSGQRLLSAMDMLKPILAESPPDPHQVGGGVSSNAGTGQQPAVNAHKRNRSSGFSGIV